MTTDGFDPSVLVEEIDTATDQVLATAERLTPDRLTGPSLLPGWTRGHVLTHLARNADAMVNLTHWASTGVRTPMYAHGERDAAIEAGAYRPLEVQLHDLHTASDRLSEALLALSPTAWGMRVSGSSGLDFPATQLPTRRLRELYIHHVDLAAAWTPAHWPSEYAERELNEVAASFRGRPDTPPLLLHVRESGRRMSVGPENVPAAAVVSGNRRALLAWLIGRATGDGLTVEGVGYLPPLPAWM